MKKKNSSTLHRWVPLKNRPTFDVCHHVGPKSESTMPDATTTRRAAMVSTPKT